MKKAYFLIRKVRKFNEKWTIEQDLIILNFVKSSVKKVDWEKLSCQIKNKNKFQCYRRYLTINPTIKKGKWTKEEDIMLIDLVQKHGKVWSSVAKIFENRTAKQIENRYENNLNPSIKKDKFKKEEDELIMKLFNFFNNKWTKYKNYFPNRSIKRIKERFMKINSLNCK